jgi:hypothetical protein
MGSYAKSRKQTNSSEKFFKFMRETKRLDRNNQLGGIIVRLRCLTGRLFQTMQITLNKALGPVIARRGAECSRGL